MPRKPMRDELVEAAMRVFYRDGFHASGIERVLTEAGVSKMTLYRHFPTKNALIVAALERRDELFRSWLFERAEGASKEPQARLAAVFDALGDWFAGREGGGIGFYGCMFANASAEFPDADDPIHQAAQAHKAAILAWLDALCVEAGAVDPKALASQLLMLKEGATTLAQIHGAGDWAAQAKVTAQALIAQATGAPRK